MGIDMQKLVDTMSASNRDVRSQYHMTLGDMINYLAIVSPGKTVVIDDNGLSPGDEMSYRGYYSDLALTEDNGEPKTVEELFTQLEGALGREYTGYKGGEFKMDEKTPLWISEYGSASGMAIVDAVQKDDSFVRLITRRVD